MIHNNNQSEFDSNQTGLTETQLKNLKNGKN